MWVLDNVTLHVYMCEWQVHTTYFWQLMHNWQHSVHHSRSAAWKSWKNQICPAMV